MSINSDSSSKDSVVSIDTHASNELERVIGLCDEISALVRTGLPLENVSAFQGKSKPGTLGGHLKRLAGELETGTSLADALRNDPAFSPVTLAVIEAGVESGDLSGALDAIAQSARTLRDTRMLLIRASLYPLVLFTSLWIVFTALLYFIGSKISGFFESNGEKTFLFEVMRYFGGHELPSLVLMVGVPLLLWSLFIAWCISSSRGSVLQSTGFFSPLGWIPWIGRAVTELRKAMFARILALLVRASVPLDRALFFAARACNDRHGIDEDPETGRRRVVAGSDRKFSDSPFSTLIRWSLGMPDRAALVEGLDFYAVAARNRAELLLSRCELFLPGFLVFCVAVLVGFCYLLTVSWPYIEALYLFSRP